MSQKVSRTDLEEIKELGILCVIIVKYFIDERCDLFVLLFYGTFAIERSVQSSHGLNVCSMLALVGIEHLLVRRLDDKNFEMVYFMSMPEIYSTTYSTKITSSTEPPTSK